MGNSLTSFVLCLLIGTATANAATRQEKPETLRQRCDRGDKEACAKLQDGQNKTTQGLLGWLGWGREPQPPADDPKTPPPDCDKPAEKGPVVCPLTGQDGVKRSTRPSPSILVAPRVKTDPNDAELALKLAAELKDLTGPLSDCYDRRLATNFDLLGKIAFLATVTPEGTVAQVVATDNATGDQELAACAVELLLKLALPAPGRQIQASFFVLFKPGPATAGETGVKPNP